MSIFLILLLKVLGKCQLREAVQDKAGGLDSIGNAFSSETFENERHIVRKT